MNDRLEDMVKTLESTIAEDASKFHRETGIPVTAVRLVCGERITDDGTKMHAYQVHVQISNKALSGSDSK